ncbi:hypothetical protein C0J50_21231 [Silurus asotus]|uniref:Uncharacterized protein n=1 Tax=Silurus asotus TaxID=30991 RepID=A0AAD5AN49_SILAS|nr:hypothetical protein C0J50_21231 [Silurus asotus]
MECGLAISQVEIVLKPKVDPEPEEEQELEEEHREQGQGREKELQRYDGVEQNNLMPSHQKEYSQMIDSSDEDDGEDWYEQPFPSDYEKHFLPCIVEA